jgi:hypothetical protein
MSDYTHRTDTASIPSDPRPNSVPIERCSSEYNVDGAESAPESRDVARYRERPMDVPELGPRNPRQGGL